MATIAPTFLRVLKRDLSLCTHVDHIVSTIAAYDPYRPIYEVVRPLFQRWLESPLLQDPLVQREINYWQRLILNEIYTMYEVAGRDRIERDLLPINRDFAASHQRYSRQAMIVLTEKMVKSIGRPLKIAVHGAGRIEPYIHWAQDRGIDQVTLISADREALLEIETLPPDQRQKFRFEATDLSGMFARVAQVFARTQAIGDSVAQIEALYASPCVVRMPAVDCVFSSLVMTQLPLIINRFILSRLKPSLESTEGGALSRFERTQSFITNVVCRNYLMNLYFSVPLEGAIFFSDTHFSSSVSNLSTPTTDDLERLANAKCSIADFKRLTTRLFTMPPQLQPSMPQWVYDYDIDTNQPQPISLTLTRVSVFQLNPVFTSFWRVFS